MNRGNLGGPSTWRESPAEYARWRQRPDPTPRHLVQPPEAERLARSMGSTRDGGKSSAAPFSRSESAHRVAVVVTETVFTMELGTIVDVFETANVCSGHALYEVAVVANSPVVRGTGLTITADYPLPWADDADTVLIPGHSLLAAQDDVGLSADYLDLFRRASERRARVGALCLGPFALAEAGVLAGRSAVTHWNWTDEFATRYPSSRVDADALYVQDGHMYTGAGAAMTIDFILHLIAEDHGAKLAAVVANYLLSPPRRHGSYSQQTDHGEVWQDLPLEETLQWGAAHVREALTVKDLADHAHMSVRSFNRYFRAYVGTTPSNWMIRMRIQCAQQFLQTTSWSMDRIAAASGFGSESTFRYHFARLVGCTPLQYRREFTVIGSSAETGIAVAEPVH